MAAYTNDRSLLREVAIHARDAYSAAGPAHRREGMAALAHAAWQRGDTQETQRWLTDDFTLLQTPLWALDLDNLVLGARVAVAAGDAGLRARVLHAAELLTGEEPGAPLFNAVAQHASHSRTRRRRARRGGQIAERVVAAAAARRRRRGCRHGTGPHQPHCGKP